MATKIPMKDPRTGLLIDGFYGFSWTSLFFGALPALIRGDFRNFLISAASMIVLGLPTFGLGAIGFAAVWAFIYNRMYSRGLLERGAILAGTEAQNEAFARALGADPKRHATAVTRE